MGLPLKIGTDGNSIESPIIETDFSFTDVTTGNASTSKHGLLPKLNNDSSTYLNGQGAFTTPEGGTGGGLTINDLKKFGLA